MEFFFCQAIILIFYNFIDFIFKRINNNNMKCPVCDTENSLYAYECSKCGYPFGEKPKSKRRWIAVIVLCIVGMAIIYYISPFVTERTKVSYWIIDGDKKFAEGDYRAASDLYSKAIDIDKSNAGYFAKRGDSYANMNEYEKAIDNFTEAIAIDPQKGEYYFKRGRAYLKEGSRPRAKADFEYAAKLGNLEAHAILMSF
jgi:tetratricopeptide (TPR) repeat protein